MGLMDQCEMLYKMSNPYDVIGVTKDASEADQATAKFQFDILNFEKSYKNCEDEKHDLMRVYVEHKGDMDRIMENVLCATLEDETQIRAILKSAISSAPRHLKRERKSNAIHGVHIQWEQKVCEPFRTTWISALIGHNI
uniref:DNAJC9 HTH domain-containing protein n=1 Tax=Oncorhynchus mykiss TaxID=8022 RepID=A0A8L0DQA1_ONCMY